MSQEEGVNLEVTRILVLQVCVGPKKMPLYMPLSLHGCHGEGQKETSRITSTILTSVDHHQFHEFVQSWVACVVAWKPSVPCVTTHFGSVSDQLSHHQPSIPLGFGANLNQLWAVFGLGNQTRIAVKTDMVQAGRSLRQRSGKSFI